METGSFACPLRPHWQSKYLPSLIGDGDLHTSHLLGSQPSGVLLPTNPHRGWRQPHPDMVVRHCQESPNTRQSPSGIETIRASNSAFLHGGPKTRQSPSRMDTQGDDSAREYRYRARRFANPLRGWRLIRVRAWEPRIVPYEDR